MGATSSIALSNIPSRLSGVAPLSVSFDATGTSHSSVARPFHDLEYSWNFGDPAGGSTWAYGSQTASSKNIAKGPVAAHVFETPGTYTVSLGVTDGTNSVSNNCTQIVVQNPDSVFSGANTTCVAANSLPVAGVAGCPAGASTAQQPSFPAAISSYARTGKRVLFKRGDTFTAAAPAIIGVAGPGAIGAFGTGTRPRIQLQQAGVYAITLKSLPADWRIMDLELDGQSLSDTRGISDQSNVSQITVLRVNVHHVTGGIFLEGDQITVADSDVTNIIGGGGGMGLYMYAGRLALLGSNIKDSTLAEHVARFPFLFKSVISNNYMGLPHSTKGVIKLHGPTWVNGVPPTGYASTYSELNVISDNKFEGTTGVSWPVVLGPQNAVSDERVRDIIVERNLFTGVDVQNALVIHAAAVTARNNLFNMTSGSTWRNCIQIEQWGAEPAPANVNVYNNSVYSADSSAELFVVKIGATATNIAVKNNLAYAPNAATTLMVSGTGASGLIVSNNSTDSQIKNSSPNFAITPPVTPANYKPAAGSYAIGGGSIVPVWSDSLLVPQTTARDIGAAIH